MSIDQAIQLMSEMIQTALFVAGPVLGAALVGGLMMGVVQTATQVNEMSLSYLVKASCVMLVFLLAGSALAQKTVQYTHDSFASIATVVK